MPAKIRHVNRRLSACERTRHEKIRAAIMKEIPPKAVTVSRTTGIAARVRKERESQQLTWYALAKRAGIPNQATIRDIEQGKDVRLSNLQRVANALGLSLELVG